MRITITVRKRRLTFAILHRNDLLLFKTHGLPIVLYKATISDKGMATWWAQRSAYYKSGFVARLLWFGFIIRHGAVKS